MNYTHRRSRRDKPAPGCPKSSCFSLQKYAREALGMAESVSMFWSRLCMGAALSKDITVRSDCDPLTERLWQQGRHIGVSSSKCGDALLAFSNDRTLGWIFL